MEFSELNFPPKSAAFVQWARLASRRLAFERAKRSPFFAGRLDHVREAHLDDQEEWAKIPILTKEELRGIPADEFHDRFAVERDELAVEYWRSGGATGRPLFYPRSGADMETALEMWRRLWLAAGCTERDKAHISFPFGIHPVSQLYARAGETLGIGTIWAGSGNNTPSEMQIELIRNLRPTVWVGMASYGLQLASLVERVGFDLSTWSVRKILCAAEPLSAPKREKLERLWNAEVFDQFRLEIAAGSTLDEIILAIEFRKGIDTVSEAAKLKSAIKSAYEVTPHIEVKPVGELAQLFASDVKAKRFVDNR